MLHYHMWKTIDFIAHRQTGTFKLQNGGKYMKNKKGFSLLELVAVIVIIGILSVAAVPVYNKYVERAILAEGHALLSAVKTAQEVYYTEHDEYAHEGSFVPNGKGRLIDVDAGKNKYFRAWYTIDAIDVSSSGYEGYGLYAKADYRGHEYVMIYNDQEESNFYNLEFFRDGESISYEEWGS